MSGHCAHHQDDKEQHHHGTKDVLHVKRVRRVCLFTTRSPEALGWRRGESHVVLPHLRHSDAALDPADQPTSPHWATALGHRVLVQPTRLSVQIADTQTSRTRYWRGTAGNVNDRGVAVSLGSNFVRPSCGAGTSPPGHATGARNGARCETFSSNNRFAGGRCWYRTSDLFGVNEALYH